MLELQNKEIVTLFPSYLFRGKVSDMSIVESLKTKVIGLRDNNVGSIHHENNYISPDNLQDNEDFKPLVDLVLQETNDILDFYGVVRDSHYVSNMWANITNPNHRHPVHIHPNCFLSGIIYLNAPENCGYTAFSDPRPAARVFEPSYKQMNETNSGVFFNKPANGDMLFWNSWLPHGVENGFHELKEERIVIAFNVMLKGKITTPTAALTM